MRPSIFWPVVMIAAGLLFLLDNLGWLPGNAWGRLWSIVSIWIGVGMLLRMRGGALPEAMTDSIPLEGASGADVTIRYGAGELRVSGGADSNLLLSGAFSGGAFKQVRRVGDRLDATLQPPDEAWTRWVWPWAMPPGHRRWRVALNPDVALALTLEVGAARTELDLANLRVTEVALKTGASATELTLPARAGLTRAKIESGAASVDVRVPEGVAARISGFVGVGALDVDTNRFPSRNGGYESADFESAANKVEIKVQSGVGAVKVR